MRLLKSMQSFGEMLMPNQTPIVSVIPLDHPLILRAKTLIPPEYWAQTWIAGSAATRFGQHNDVDVWVTNVPRTMDPWHVLPCNEGTEMPVGDPEQDYEHLCIKVYNNPEERLQIMASHDSIAVLLEGFDISCHAGAINLVTGAQCFASLYGPRVTVVNYLTPIPQLTLTRYLTFAKRYKDWSGMFDEKTRECAARSFQLKTPEDMQTEIRYLQMDRGL